MDRVYIEGLKVQTLIGVYEFERHAAQDLFLDLSIAFDCQPAGETDNFELALDYDRLSTRVRQWSEQQSFALIEAYAEKLCQLLHQEFQVTEIALKVNKPAAVKDCSAVGISMTRHFEV